MRHGIMCLLSWVVLGLLPAPAHAQQPFIAGIQSGFEVTNQTSVPADDFHLVVTGVPCGAVVDTRMPRGWTFACDFLPDGSSHFSWTGAFPILPGETAFFGLELAGSPDWRVVCAYWTWNGRVLFPLISWPNQRWLDGGGAFLDIVNGYRPPLNASVTIQRETALNPLPIALPQLTWNETFFLPWQPAAGPEVIPNLPDSFFDVFLETFGMPAALVRYPVTSPAGVLQARYVNQVDISPFNPPSLFSNFDAWNRTNVCVNDFHVVLDGVSSANLLAGSQGIVVPSGWGAQIIDLPMGGVEIHWLALDGSCVAPGDMRHFGYGLNTLEPFSITACYWTWNGVPVFPFLEPVQQTWVWGGAPFVIDRVWGFPPLVEPNGLLIRRDFAFQPLAPLSLDELTWAQSGALPWQPADPVPQWIPPDSFFDVFFAFPQAPPETAGLLIRYEATTTSGSTGLRFVNQALLGGVVIPPPSIQDLRIEYLGETEEGQGHFRLSWTPPPSPGGLLLYRIYGYTDPYDPSLGSEMGVTVDSFFDVFLEGFGRTQAPPTFFRVTAETLPTAE